MASPTALRSVYVIGAGFSAGLGFPTVVDLLPKLWAKMNSGLADDIGKVVRFHHPDFNPSLPDSYLNIEQMLSEMKANSQLFESSRPATGSFTAEDLEDRRQRLLLHLAEWFHELQADALRSPPEWLKKLVAKIQTENSQVISFNWDLVLDELLFGDDLKKSDYACGKNRKGPRLIKPHGSLNWFEHRSGKHLKREKTLRLFGGGAESVITFRPFRAPISKHFTFMPLIVPPEYLKEFENSIFKHLWQETVSVLSTASKVTFLGFSLPQADFHARFILRCGFHNQEHGELKDDGSRSPVTGRATVTIVDPGVDGPKRVTNAVGWHCDWRQQTVEQWVQTAGIDYRPNPGPQ